MQTAEELFKSITGFNEVDVNLLEGVHTTYNSLACRFEIAPDDNRNVSYPFEYCWQKTNEEKAKSDKSDDNEEDEFEEMWNHAAKSKTVDSAANFGNEVKIDNEITSTASKTSDFRDIIDHESCFANEFKGTIPTNSDGDTSSSRVEKKS